MSYSENVTVGKVCKVSAIVMFILDFIGSITLGRSLGYYDFNWGIFFSGIVVGFIFCMLIYAIGEIIDCLDNINTETLLMRKALEKLSNEDNDNENQSTDTKRHSIFESTTSIDLSGTWTCEKCGSHNPSTSRVCKGCGEYK